MSRRLFKTMWGAVGTGTRYPTFAEAIPAVAADGYDGIVFALIALQFDPDIGSMTQLHELCEEHGLDRVFMVMSEGEGGSEHASTLVDQIELVRPFGPAHVVAHTGQDSFDREERDRCLAEMLRYESELPFPVGHETHRTRILYNPWVTRNVMADHPELRFVIDLSHWVVVAERLLTAEVDWFEELALRSLHIDARVGHEEGPQVPDPRVEAWGAHVVTFEAWWTAMLAANPDLIVVPEYGPPPYQTVDSADTDPSQTLWDICNWSARRLRLI